MRKIFNERHIEKEEQATDLDILRELDKRTEFNENFSMELKRLEAKEKGVAEVLTLINKYAKDHWFFMTDLSLDYYNSINCDLLLMTSAGIHTFEINYYEGLFEGEGGQASINGNMLKHNPIEKAQRVTSQLKSLSMMNSVNLNIKGAALFPGPNNKLIVHDDMKDIEVVTAKFLEFYLMEIVQEEENYKGPDMITLKNLRWLGKIDRYNPNWSIKVQDELEEYMQKGILCSHCGSFDVKIDEPYISCACGLHESLEEATVRTICEYGVLNNDKNLGVDELLDFFDYQVSEDTLYKYLDKHFTPAF